MCGEYLDDFARIVSAGFSRRGFIGRFAVSFASVLPFTFRDERAEGKKKKRKRKKPCKCPICLQCQGGICISAADDVSCNGDGRCLDGQCNPRPACTSAGFGCDLQAPETCCSTVCVPTGPFNAACQISVAGQVCKSNDDCASGSCVGYRCRD